MGRHGVKRSITDSQSVWDTRLAVVRQGTALCVRFHIITLCDGSPPHLGLAQIPGKTLSCSYVEGYVEGNPLLPSMWWGPCNGCTYNMQRPFDLGVGLN